MTKNTTVKKGEIHKDAAHKRASASFAKTLALLCVRNTMLENFHAGEFPSSKTGDFSDVKIIDGFGNEIPWNDASRLSDPEMRLFMKEVVNKLFTYLAMVDHPGMEYVAGYGRASASYFDEPELDEDMMYGLEKAEREGFTKFHL